MRSHASNPTPLVVGDSTVRVFFSCRDTQKRSHIGFVDIDMERDFMVTKVSEVPCLEPGQLGTFDDSGVSIGCLLQTPRGLEMYYVGWNLKVTVPWGNSIGKATLDESKERFINRRLAPVLDRSDEDPFSLSYPSVIHFDGLYHMYYGSNLSWGESEPTMIHTIKHAYSPDARQWHREGRIAVELDPDREEYAISRPFVRHLPPGRLQMFYSYRGHREPESYRIGMAVSDDGLNWSRQDKAVGITVSETGWDSEMLEYPSVFDYKDRTYMLYNGNGYGLSGFGLAQLVAC